MQPPAQPFIVLLAMPATREEYFLAARREPRSDYLRHTLAGAVPELAWEDRYGRIVEAASDLTQSMLELGVPVLRQATLNDFAAATRQAQTVVVFAHWAEMAGTDERTGRKRGALEFADGFADAEAIEAALSPGFGGTLDLCTCHSVVPAAHLKSQRGDSMRVVYGTKALDPLPALVIVRHLIELAIRHGVDYRLARLQAAAALVRPG